MSHVILSYRTRVATADGRRYTAQACGREREDATWEGWLEFVPDDGSATLVTSRETTQPKRSDLEYWATGLTPVYLEGALQRALTPSPGPAADVVIGGEGSLGNPVLDPFSVYAKGEDLLRRQLAALSSRHLRSIVVAYGLAPAGGVDLEALTGTELMALILVAVRARLAA
jgi:hypothetical protein